MRSPGTECSWLDTEQVGDRRRRLEGVRRGRDLAFLRHSRSRRYPRDLNLRQGRAAAFSPYATVIRSRAPPRGLKHAVRLQRLDHADGRTVDSLNRGDIPEFRARSLAGVIDLVEVDEQQVRLVPPQVVHRQIRGLGRALDVLDRVRNARFDQAAEALPVPEDGNGSLRPLGTQLPEDCGEDAVGARTDGGTSNLSGSPSFAVTPCRSGPAPMIIEAQLGLLDAGITPRACMVVAPRARRLAGLGASAFAMPAGLSPSTPITMTCCSGREPRGRM